MRLGSRLSILLAAYALLLIVLPAVNPGTAEAFWVSSKYDNAFGSTPDTTMRYTFYNSTSYRYWAPGSAQRLRMADAAYEWTDAAGYYAGFNIYHSSSSTNRAGWSFPQDMNYKAGYATIGCDSDSSYCVLWMNNSLTWYTASTGAMSTNAYHFAATLTHELGHWLGLLHDCPTYARTGPPPSSEAKTMCMQYFPWTTVHETFTPSQDEVQGVIYAYSAGFRDISANYEFKRCSSSAGTCTPTYWEWRADSNKHWWWWDGSDGLVSINNGTTFPYPELVQHGWGPSVDDNGDLEFRITAYVKGRYEDYPAWNTRAVLFVRFEDGSNERKCDNYPSGLPMNQWVQISCDLTLPDADRQDKYEFGIRVTDKTDVDWIKIEDI